jgi:beta-glucosidase
MPLQFRSLLNRFVTLSVVVPCVALSSWAQSGNLHPWSNTSLSPDERAAMVVKEMTLDEKITLLHGTGMKA